MTVLRTRLSNIRHASKSLPFEKQSLLIILALLILASTGMVLINVFLFKNTLWPPGFLLFFILATLIYLGSLHLFVRGQTDLSARIIVATMIIGVGWLAYTGRTTNSISAIVNNIVAMIVPVFIASLISHPRDIPITGISVIVLSIIISFVPVSDETIRTLIEIHTLDISQPFMVAIMAGTLYIMRVRIEQRTIEAEISKEQYKEFLAQMTHEMRSPANATRTMLSSVLDKKNLSEWQEKRIKIAEVSAYRSQYHIEMILDINSIERGMIQLKVETFSLNEIINLVLEWLPYRVGHKNVEIKSILADITLTADKNRLIQAANNLLLNAAKFTESGYIHIKTEVQDSCVLISVEDTGVGIHPTATDIFAQYAQTDTGRDYGGSGIGLYITKKIVDLHHGQIWYKSNGTGTTFYMKLPLEYTDEGTVL